MGEERLRNGNRGLALILLAFIVLFITMCLASCKTKKAVVVESKETSIDTIVEDHFIVDTIYKVFNRHDSIYMKDSVYVHAKNDTIWVEKSSTKFIERLRIDTLWKDRVVVNTRYESKVDSIPIVKTVEVEKKLSFKERFKMLLMDIGISIILAVLVLLGIKFIPLISKLR